MALLALVMATAALVIGAMAAHLVTVLSLTDLDARVILFLASLKGVAQTVARLLDLIFGTRLPAMTLARGTYVLLPLSFMALLVPGAGLLAATVFVVLFGAANGLVTIVRGTVPLALFGTAGYGAVLGKLATPIALMNAIAPMAFAFLVDRAGLTSGIVAMLVLSVFAVLSIELTQRWISRNSNTHA